MTSLTMEKIDERLSAVEEQLYLYKKNDAFNEHILRTLEGTVVDLGIAIDTLSRESKHSFSQIHNKITEILDNLEQVKYDTIKKFERLESTLSEHIKIQREESEKIQNNLHEIIGKLSK